jgi:hypothetical protein
MYVRQIVINDGPEPLGTMRREFRGEIRYTPGTGFEMKLHELTREQSSWVSMHFLGKHMYFKHALEA